MEVWRDPSGAQGLGVQPFQARKSSGMSQQHLVSPRTCPGFLRHSPQHVTGRMAARGDILWVSIVFRHITSLGVTAVDAHPRRVHACLALTGVRLRWAFMGGTLLQPSLPDQYRGNVAEGQRSPSWGGFAAPGARLEPRRVPTMFVTRSLPKTLGAIASPTGGRGPARGHILGLHLLPHGDILAGPPRSKGHRAARDAAAHWLWDVQPQGCPRGGRHSAPASAPLTFPCLGPLCSRNDPYLSPVCAACPPVSCLLNVPVQVPSEFPVTPVSPVRLCNPVSHVPAVRSPLLEPRTFQCPFCAFCVSCACPVPPPPTCPLCVPHKSPHMLPACALLVSSVCPCILCVPMNPPRAPLTCPACLQCVFPRPTHAPTVSH